jgi:hypothetical protein
VLEGGDEVYVDVFAGQLLEEEGLRWGWLGLWTWVTRYPQHNG